MTHSHVNHDYSKSLNIVLKNVSLYTCKECGEDELEIMCSGPLHEAIAKRIAISKQKLNSRQIRFLRKHLCLRSKELATALGVQPETVSRWENEEIERYPSPPAEKLLRLLVLTSFDTSESQSLGSESGVAEAIELKFREEDRRWVDISEPDHFEIIKTVYSGFNWDRLDTNSRNGESHVPAQDAEELPGFMRYVITNNSKATTTETVH